MFSHIKAYLTQTATKIWCYSSQPRLVANGFLGSGSSITSYSKQDTSTGSTHYLWLADGIDVNELSSSHPVIYLETKDGRPTGNYLNQAEYDALSTSDTPDVQPSQQQAV